MHQEERSLQRGPGLSPLRVPVSETSDASDVSDLGHNNVCLQYDNIPLWNLTSSLSLRPEHRQRSR